MRKHHCVLAVLAALFLAGCSAPLGPNPLSQESSALAATGSLSITIPAVAPWLAAELPGGDPGTRAFLHAGRAVVQIFEATGTDSASLQWVEVGTATTLTVLNDISSTNISGTVTGIPIGRGYRVVVSIFAKVADAEPSVVGTRDDVDIWPNSTNPVSVVCVPKVADNQILDLRTTDLTSSPYDSGDITLGGSSETWYAVKLKPRVQYIVSFRSSDGIPAFAFGPQGQRWGNTLTNGNDYGYAFDAGETLYFGVSGAGIDGSFGVAIREQSGSLVQGALVFPLGSENKRYRFFLDNDNDRTNKNWCWSNDNRVYNDSPWSFWMASVPAGTYYLWGVLEDATPWTNTNWGDPGFVPGPATGDLETPVVMVTVDGTGTVTFSSSSFPWTPYTAP